ncbi:hypothetical protein [Spongiivirga citrea]|uniref:Uncharacterized protein n=1 Tax=Spongiivirga citrea TaxID=1481457 RepID=A0A6M0CKQ0_9FLAO|nr:hypothetical protein [Spongiivirga citrea]NER16017.1 hypothetical protein [Spongiivirga citrea]
MAKNIFKSDWFSSTIGSMIGVLAAFLLNNLWNDYQSNKQQELVIQNIQSELSSNAEILEESIEKLDTYLTTFTQFNRVYNSEESKIIATPIDMNLLRRSTSDLFRISDSIPLENGKYEYKGEIQLFYNFNMLDSQLKESAWNSALAIGELQKFPIKKVQTLEETYSFQNKVKDKATKLTDGFLEVLLRSTSQKEAIETMNVFVTDINLYKQYNELLLIGYQESLDQLKLD